MENKYINSKIYKIEPICDHEEGDIYIGSTTQKYLCKRMIKHRSDYKRWKDNSFNKLTSFDIFEKYGIENCHIVLLECINLNSIDELRAKESQYIKTMKCVNKHIPGRTLKEYQQTEKIQNYYKEYRENNKESKKETDKKYRENNKEKIKERKTEPFICICGCEIKRDEKARHMRSKKHIKILEEQN